MSNKKLIHQYITTGRKIPKEQLVKLNPSQRKSYNRTRLLGGVRLEEYEFFMLPYEQQEEYLNNIKNMDVRVLIQMTQEREDFLKHLDILLSHDKIIKNFDLSTLGRILKKSKESGYNEELIKRLLNNDKFKNNVKPIDQLYFYEFSDDFRSSFKYFGEDLIQTIKNIEPHNLKDIFIRRKNEKLEVLQFLNKVAPSVLGKITYDNLQHIISGENMVDKADDVAKTLLSNKYFIHNMNEEHLIQLIELLDNPFDMERYISEKRIKKLMTDYLSDDYDRKWLENNIKDGNVPKEILKFITKYK